MSRSLTSVCLEACGIDDITVLKVSNALMSSNSNLETLLLGMNKLTDVGLLDLFRVGISRCSTLKELDLAGNLIRGTDETVNAISDSLLHRTQLKK